jgi:glycosyltransferase involved in cell wall biosynthesis
VRICIVYDCLYPCTVGGAERWYAGLARRLAEEGHEVTYLTLRQWGDEGPPAIPGVRLVAVGPWMPLYANGRRRVLPPLVFGLGVLRHLLARGGRYDIVHTASFPYFSVLAAAAVRRVYGFRIVVDWHEVWTRGYWDEYLGRRGGALGWRVQRLCLRVPQRAFCFSRLHERRLQELGVNGPVTRLEGEYDGPTDLGEPLPAEPVIVYAGRHIPEKRVTALVPAFLEARKQIPELRMEIFGDGPDREKVLRQVAEHGLEDVVDVPGFVPEERIDAALRRALCLVLPSRREGYGLVVIEAAARGVPSVVVAGEDNATVEFVENGVNGVVAPSDRSVALAASIVRVHKSGFTMRASAAAWFKRRRAALALSGSLNAVVAAYR